MSAAEVLSLIVSRSDISGLPHATRENLKRRWSFDPGKRDVVAPEDASLVIAIDVELAGEQAGARFHDFDLFTAEEFGSTLAAIRARFRHHSISKLRQFLVRDIGDYLAYEVRFRSGLVEAQTKLRSWILEEKIHLDGRLVSLSGLPAHSHTRIEVRNFLNGKTTFAHITDSDWGLVQHYGEEFLHEEEARILYRYVQFPGAIVFSLLEIGKYDVRPLANRDLRPKPTDASLTSWFGARVNTWPENQTPPSERADWLAVESHFGDGLKRDAFRRYRKRLVPVEWQKSGPRKLWGVTKAAIAQAAVNCANLPRQK